MRRRYFNAIVVFLIIYLFWLGALTLAPFNFSIATIAERTSLFGETFISDVVLNIFLFLPFGAILYFLTGPDSKSVISKWGLASCAAAILSLSIETGQVFLPTRFPSPADFLANTVGGGLGFGVAHYLQQARWTVHLLHFRRQLVVAILSFYVASLITLFLWARTAQELKGWDPTYPLLIGNEATLDRPWLGKIFLLALYDRVLTIEEIESQFKASARFESKVYLQGVPVALYSFQDGGGTRIHDLSPTGVPLDLEVADPQKTTWLPGGGLELTGPTVLHSIERPEKVHHRFTATDTFSVAAWFEPKDLLQSGPARIVSFSRSPYLRNFTLGQDASEIHLRVRNRIAGLNGIRLDLRTNGLELHSSPTFVVAIYDRGTERLYVNAELVHTIATADGFTLIGRALGTDTSSGWRKGFLMLVLLGPVGGCWILARG